MTKNEKIDAIERELWLMEFKEHWTSEDWLRQAKLNQELNLLKG